VSPQKYQKLCIKIIWLEGNGVCCSVFFWSKKKSIAIQSCHNFPEHTYMLNISSINAFTMLAHIHFVRVPSSWCMTVQICTSLLIQLWMWVSAPLAACVNFSSSAWKETLLNSWRGNQTDFNMKLLLLCYFISVHRKRHILLVSDKYFTKIRHLELIFRILW
jgi:hypothetical protein